MPSNRRAKPVRRWGDEHRERIQTSMLVNRLTDHVVGKADLSQTQVRAIEILLRKTLPDLSAVEHSGEVKTPLVAEVPPVARDMDEWARLYAPASTVPSGQPKPDSKH